MTFTMWVVLALSMVAAYGLGWIAGDYRGQCVTNRQWTAESNKRHIETKYQLGLAGLSLNSHRTEQ